MITCPWPIDIIACCKSAGVEPDDERVEGVIARVSEMLTRWSGFAYGGCRTVRPLEPCGECRVGCCSSGDCIVLHDARAVLEVRVDGEVIDPSQYHMGSRGTLCAVPPLRWPTRDPQFSDVGALEVDVRVGAEPDAWAMAVANELACELLQACVGKQCRLPQRATQVTGQGVTITISDDEIKYAIPSISAWVASINPAGAVMPSRVFSPEVDRARVVGSARRGRYWG